MSTTQKKSSLSQDMTQGSPWKGIALFSVPLLIGNVFQQLYNTVDTIVVGRLIGENALAAVGFCGTIIFFFVSLFIGISTGAGVVISQAFGAKDQERLRKGVGTVYALTILVGVLLTVLGLLLTRPILQLLNTPPDVLADAETYLRIIFIGMIGSAMYNMVGGILRGVGDSFTPLLFLIVATLLNIGLDLLFVMAFDMGVAGVAWATIIAQTISAILCIIRVNTMDDALHFKIRRLKIDRRLLPEILRIGLPSGVQQISISLGMMAIQGLINSLGSSVMAGYTAAMRVDTFATMPMMTISMALTTFVGQNVGARKMERISKGVRASLLMVVGISAVLCTLIYIFAPSLLHIFSDSAGAIQAGQEVLRVLVPFYVLLGLMFCMGGVMRGAGEPIVPMVASIFSVVAIRVPLAYLLYNLFGTASSIWWSFPIGWAIGLLYQGLYYRFGKWRQRSIARMDKQLAAEGSQGET